MPESQSLSSTALAALLPAATPVILQPMVSKALGLPTLARLYRSLQRSKSLPQDLTTHLAVRYSAADGDLAHVPATGACIAVVNHPFGILDGAVIAALLQRRRPDVKFLANQALIAIPEIANLLIPLDALRNGVNSTGVRKALEHLESGGMLVVFPAGEVSHFQWKHRRVTDPEWSAGVVRFVELAARKSIDTPVIPMHVSGENSSLFQLAGLMHPRLRTALLVRELLNKRGCEVEVRIGRPIGSDRLLAIPTARERIDYLRWRTYLLAARQSLKPRTAWPLWRRQEAHAVSIADPVPSSLLNAEIASIRDRYRLLGSGSFEVFCTPASAIPSLLREIGRLRELTFRRAGEGTGRALDLDAFDTRYEHLFVWNREREELVGGYRLAKADPSSSRELYTATLFDYDSTLLHRIGPAIELGRSFVRAEYQKSFSPLLLLWKGIGQYVAREPRYKTLLGPVSISNEYQSISRRLMLSYLERRSLLRELMQLVRPKNPPAAAEDEPCCKSLDELSAVISDIEPSGAGVPVLLRQYLKLGGKLLGFNIDSKFSNVLDGLILVDLTKTSPNLLERYLGRNEALQFLSFHKGVDPMYGTH